MLLNIVSPIEKFKSYFNNHNCVFVWFSLKYLLPDSITEFFLPEYDLG